MGWSIVPDLTYTVSSGTLRYQSIRSRVDPPRVDPPHVRPKRGRSAPVSGTFRPNTHMPKYKLRRNKIFHRRWLVTSITQDGMLISSYSCSTHNSMSDVHRRALHIFIASVITRIGYLTLRVSAWRRRMAASALNVTFAKPIAWCLSTMSCAVNTCLGIALNIESTSLLCWPSGAGARHRQRMSS